MRHGAWTDISIGGTCLIQGVEYEGEGCCILLCHCASVMVAENLKKGEVGLGDLPASQNQTQVISCCHYLQVA